MTKSEMSVDLQLDPALDPPPNIAQDALRGSLAALVSITNDDRLQQEVCVRVCTEAESATLNATYRGKSNATNVLSFPTELEIPDQAVPLGDLAVCWPIVLAEAAAQGKSVEDHFSHLFLHGVLHLLGYDHETDADALEMEDLEIRTLAVLGITNPYAPCK